MFKIEDSTIHLTRGDKAEIELTISNYELKADDRIIFTVKKKFDAKDFVIRKVVEVTDEMIGSNTISILLEKDDTTIGGLIAQPVKYQYDISLNDDVTIIGYDEDGAKYFILYPEGSNDE